MPRHRGVELAPLVACVDGYLTAMERETWPEGLEMPTIEAVLSD